MSVHDAANASLPADRPARGRGRPRKDNPLSGAERARRCRERKRLNAVAASNRPAASPAGETERLHAEIAQLRTALAAQERAARHAEEACRAACRDAADLQGLAQLLIDARLKKQLIPADVFARLATSPLLARRWKGAGS